MKKALQTPDKQRKGRTRSLIVKMVCGIVECADIKCADCLFSTATHNASKNNAELQERIQQRGCEILLDLLEKEK